MSSEAIGRWRQIAAVCIAVSVTFLAVLLFAVVTVPEPHTVGDELRELNKLHQKLTRMEKHFGEVAQQ